MPNCSIWPRERIILDQRVMVMKGYSGASPSDCLILYPGHLLGESHPQLTRMYKYRKLYIYILSHKYIFLSLRIFGLLCSSLLLFPRFGRYVLQPSSGSNMELRTTSFIESTGVACSDSIKHSQVQVLNIPVLLRACSQDWTSNLQMIVSLQA